MSPPSSRPADEPPHSRRSRWTPLWFGVIALAVILTLGFDLAHARWAARLSLEGSPAPALVNGSPTGFTQGQRHFLGTTQRGETYRWIAATQTLLDDHASWNGNYTSDNLPDGRPRLVPRLYALWTGAIARVAQPFLEIPRPVAVERAALWEPVVSHALALLGIALFMGSRFGLASAAAATAFVAVYPPFFSQFLPGALAADTWALLAAAWAVASALVTGWRRHWPALGIGSAIAAAVSLWLNPAFGFPAVLIIAAGAAAVRSGGGERMPFLSWSLVGAALVTAGWLINQNPWDPRVSELRYVHPFYAIAWLGIGLILLAWQNLGRTGAPRRFAALAAGGGVLLLVPLAYTQFHHGFWGWLQPTAELRRLASIDHSRIHANVFDWLGHARIVDIVLVCTPLIVAAALVLQRWIVSGREDREDRPALAQATAVLAGLLLMSVFEVRWLVLATLVTVPLVWSLVASTTPLLRRAALGGFIVYLLVLIAWSRGLPPSLRPLLPPNRLTAADHEALVFRQLSHWLASHMPGRELRVLAPPALSDSIIFHGGNRALLSTAWESHAGHVAASRILSSPEATEAHAVIESLGLTHVILSSWDRVLPLLVKAPLEKDRDTLHDRLQRWVLPPYLRPIAYRLPDAPGFESEKLAVFEVVPPQDEALLLSRLAEYFAEVARPEPAALVAQTLMKAYPEDPNAAMARALVHDAAKNRGAFDTELDRLVSQVAKGLIPMDWDRRVVRAIVLALGGRHDLARPEIVACCGSMTPESLHLLSPLQSFQLRKLIEVYRLEFPSPELGALAAAQSGGYGS